MTTTIKVPDALLSNLMRDWVTLEDAARFNTAGVNKNDRDSFNTLYQQRIDEMESFAPRSIEELQSVMGIASPNNRLKRLDFSQLPYHSLTDDICIETIRTPISETDETPKFRNITALNLIGTGITDESLTAIAATNLNLLALHLRCHTISNDGIITLVRANPDLQILDLGVMEITSTTLQTIAAHNHKLTELVLSECEEITGAGVESIVTANPNLQKINLERTDITDTSLHAIARSNHNLIEFDVSECYGITDSGITAVIQGNPKLKVLRMNMETDEPKLGRASIQALVHCSANLTELGIQGGTATMAEGLSYIGELPHLTNLNSANSYFSATQLASLIAKTTTLEILDLTACELNKAVAEAISLNPNLDTLIICNCGNIPDEFLSTLAQYNHKLTTIDFADSIFTQSTENNAFLGLRQLIKANTNLKTLNLSKTNVTDADLQDVINATPGIRSLDLSNTAVQASTVDNIIAATRAGIADRVEQTRDPITAKIDVIFPNNTRHTESIKSTPGHHVYSVSTSGTVQAPQLALHY